MRAGRNFGKGPSVGLLASVFAVAGLVPVLAFGASGTPAKPTCHGRAATILGSRGPDRLQGTAHSDVIVAGRGDDVVAGRGGDDSICAGRGADTIRGGGGRDRLQGGPGDDLLDGGGEIDRCTGGRGNDRLRSCETMPAGPAARTSPVNRLPEARPLTAATDEDSAVELRPLSAASDPDGDPLSLGPIEAAGTRGTVAITAPNVATFSPDGLYEQLGEGEAATTTFGFRIEDGRGGEVASTATVTVSGRDDPAVAVADTASVLEGDPATPIDVLANDTDVDGGAKLIGAVGDPDNGSAALAVDGTGLEYTPDPGYCNDGGEPDRFEYTLAGGSTASVAVSVACRTVVTADPTLEPAFSAEIEDYTVRCASDPVEVAVRTAAGTAVAVDGGAAASGSFAAAVGLDENQEFAFDVDDGIETRTYHVRCLPSDFPTLSYERFRQPGHDFYLATPTFGAQASPYAVVFDDFGVPVWWYADGQPNDFKVLAEGNFAWYENPTDGYTIRELDGTELRKVAIADGTTDLHDLQQLPNGNFLAISYEPREGVDFRPVLGPDAGSDETVSDGVIEEIGPNGELLWKWSSNGRIALAETGRWFPDAFAFEPRDIVHMNAVEPVNEDADPEPEAILFSARHLDAVYKIDRQSGEVVWKLGGTWTPKSLTLVGDPEGAAPLGGQHDVRLQPNGTITIHDNNTNQPSTPRAVRYAIDETAKTATMVEEVHDPEAAKSFCCGSARRYPDGSWLMSWGGLPLITEFDQAGQRTFSMRPAGAFSYRAVAAPDGLLDKQALRAGMDSMFPR